MTNGGPTIADFVRLLIGIKQLSRRDPDVAEKKAKSLANLVHQNLPLTNDPVAGTKRAELLEEIRLLILDIRLARSAPVTPKTPPAPSSQPLTTTPSTSNVVPFKPKK